MKLAGCILILAGACGMYLSFRKSAIETLRLAELLAEDLVVLRCGICIHRRALPEILRSDLVRSPAAGQLWSVLATALERPDATVRICWTAAVQRLPSPLDGYLMPLGALLPLGGDTLARAVDEVRDELLHYVKRHREELSQKMRLTAAMCFSVAALFILVCL